MKTVTTPGVDALELLTALRREFPEIERAEEALGSRLLVARNVLELRVRSGITQTELARRVGTSQPRIAQIEAAEANVTVDTLDRIAAAFGVQTATLFKGPSRLRGQPDGASEAK
jgi:DNA-binding XRE family transcriptional regulator